MIDFITRRLKEPSTWRGVVALCAVFGISVSPEMQQAITGAAIGIIAAIEIFRKEGGVK